MVNLYPLPHRNRPQPGNVRMLLELYGVTGPERDGLIQLTRETRQPGWWHSFRAVGGSEVMRGQLRHLADAARQGKTTVQVVPYRAGAHAGTTGPFVILDHAEVTDPAVVYVETLAGDIYLEKRSDVDRYTLAFDRLVAAALHPDDSVQLIERLASSLTQRRCMRRCAG